VKISRDALSSFGKGPAPLPPPVEPRLGLVEELVLLSLDAPNRPARRAARVAGSAYPDGPRDHDAALQSLRERGLVADNRAMPDAKVAARRERMLAIVRGAATPTGQDAELLALVIAAQALPLDSGNDHLRARTHLISIGRASEVPPAIAELVDATRGAQEPADLADALLPPDLKLKDAKFDSGTTGSLGV
jgi:hypothetical protein